ncbi:MAG: hypothetical protein ACUVS7_14520, partial [Bryobacteraceae bacterium]
MIDPAAALFGGQMFIPWWHYFLSVCGHERLPTVPKVVVLWKNFCRNSGKARRNARALDHQTLEEMRIRAVETVQRGPRAEWVADTMGV